MRQSTLSKTSLILATCLGIPLVAWSDVAPRVPKVVDRAGQSLRALDPIPTPPPAESDPQRVRRASQADGYWIDPDGRRHEGTMPENASELPASEVGEGALAASELPPPLALVTIDSLTTSSSYTRGYQPYREFYLLEAARTYYLSNGTSWLSGAGGFTSAYCTFQRAEQRGDTLRYFFIPRPDSLVFQHTDYDGGDHSSQGSLVVHSPLVMEAISGSRTAVMRGYLRIRDNEMTWYGEPAFHFFSAIPGSVVPFQITYTNLTGPWRYNSLDAICEYTSAGKVDFAHPLSTPALAELAIRGPRQVPAATSTAFGVVARYVGNVQRDVRHRAAWSVSPASAATVAAGVLAVGTITTSRQALDLSASFTHDGTTLVAQQTVTAMRNSEAPDPSAWPMFQADPAHTGYRPLALSSSGFAPLWTRQLSTSFALNPVTAAEGRVFCSLLSYFPPAETQQLFALDAANGATLWSRSYGRVYSVNPPSFAYGNVYLQTGNSSSDTYMRALDAVSGASVFDTPHSAQWEQYLSPTVERGNIYANGGSYGGMYRFDAYSGRQSWFNGSLPQYDEWTPALDDSNAYAHLGSYAPGLYVVSRTTGLTRFSIMDPYFSWNGWSMGNAPIVVGNGDVLAVHGGRLICFDIPQHYLKWQLTRAFTGHPALHAGVIYAIDGGRLVAIDEATHTDLWSWQPATGALANNVIVTDTHVFASTSATTYAVDLNTHAVVWSYPAGGSLALGNGALYVATSGGALHAIGVSAPPVATTLVRFDASATVDGARVRWEFATPAEVASAVLERAEREAGPWVYANVEEWTESGVVTALDREVESGREYWYRLAVRFTDGARRTFEPITLRLPAEHVANDLHVMNALSSGQPVQVRYGLSRAGVARVAVLDVQGRVVETLARGPHDAGSRTVTWDGATSVSAGVYFVALEAPGFRATRRVVVSR